MNYFFSTNNTRGKRSSLLLSFLAISLLFLTVVFGYFLQEQYRRAGGASALVQAALSLVSLNSGATEVNDATDITSATTGLSPDIGGYRWSVSGSNYAVLNVPFDSGSPITDVSGSGLSGTISGGATYNASCKVGGCLTFDGTDDQVSFGDVTATEGVSALSFGAWIKPTEYTQTTSNLDLRSILTKGSMNGDNTSTFSSFFQGNNTTGYNFICSVDTTTDFPGLFVDAETYFPLNTWTHYMCSWTTGGPIRLYINGVEVSTTGNVGGVTVNTVFPLYVGFSDNGTDDKFKGDIDEAQVYARNLSASQVQQLYNDGNAGNGAPTIIQSEETTVGQLWDLSIRPITSAGSVGSAVTSSNTVAVSGMAVLSATPAHHAIDIARSSNIVIVFDKSLSTGTVTNMTMPVYGSYTGLIAGAYSFSTTTLSNDTVTFNPTTDFMPNERVEVMVSTGIQSTTADTLYPGRVYDFTIEVPSTNNNFDPMPPFASTVTTVFDYGSALGDFNNDNTLDFVLSPEGPHASEAVVVFRGNGNGTFSEAYRSAFSFNDRTWFIALGDFDRDGNLDFAMTSGNTGLLSIFVGNGSFGFTKTTFSAVTSCCAYGLFVSDLSGDGIQDIAIPEINNNKMSVLIGNGSGGFGSPTAYPTGTDRMLTIGGGDMNGDKRVDLVGPGYVSSDISVILGAGNGTFGSPILSSVGNNTQFRIYLNDFNADGDFDAATEGSSGFTTFNNNGSGSLSAGTSVAGTASGLQGGDFDADGDIDLVKNDASTTLQLRVNNGSGSFSSFTNFVLGNAVGSDNMAAGDVDNNGTLDLVAINKSNQNVYVLLNSPNSMHVLSVTPTRNALAVGANANVVMVFDRSLNTSTVNQTNLPVFGSLRGRIAGAYTFSTTTLSNDTVTFNPTADFEPGEHVRVSVSTAVQSTGVLAVTNGYQSEFYVDVTGGTGIFVPVTDYGAGTTPFFGCSGDFNNDGDIDIAVADQGANAIEVYTNNGSGVFSGPVNFGATSNIPFTAICVDVNKDGNDDVVFSNLGGANIGVLMSNGNDTFAAAAFYGSFSTAYGLASGDFNSDGALDLAVGQQNATSFAVLLNSGTGTFGSATTYSTGTIAEHRAVATADFNNDNILDIAVQSRDDFANPKVGVSFGNGNGTFGPISSPITVSGSDGRGLLAGDVNNDGKSDIVALHGGADFDVVLGTGAGTFAAPVSYASMFDGGTCLSMVFADVDNDNDLDLFGGCAGAQSMGIAKNNGSGVFTSYAQVATYGSYATQVLAGDFNGDGAVDGAIVDNGADKLKLLLQDVTAPQVAITQPNGGQTLNESSNYSIIWRAFDDSGTVSSISLELTTNDSTYSAIPGGSGLANDSAYPFLLQWGTAGSGNGQLNSQTGLDIDRDGNIYVADTNNNRVQKFSPTGTYISAFGSSGSGNGQFSGPRDLAFDDLGNIYVTDNGNNRVQKFNSAGTYLTQWGTFGTGNGQFDSPWGIDVDGYNNVYVVDRTNNRVQVFSTAGVFSFAWGTAGSGNGQFSAPRGIVATRTQLIYVADESNHRIQRFNTGGTFQLAWGSNGSGNGQFSYPQSIDVDAQGRVYVSDGTNHRVQRFSATGTYQAQFGSFGTGDGQFDRPFGLTVDPMGQLYVSDTFNNRIQKFTPGGTFSWTVPNSPTAQARIRMYAFDSANQDNSDISDATFTITGPNQAPTSPTGLFSNNTTAQTGATNPTGLSDSTPAFSALCNDLDAGDILNKYRIQVDNDSNFSSVIWDSGVAGTSMANCTAGSRSADIHYGGTALAFDGATYFWRIKFWDDDNTEGAFSETVSTNTFTMQAAGSSQQRIRQANLPTTPTAGVGAVIDSQTIRWQFTDTAGNESGFRLLAEDGAVLVESETVNLSFIDESNLAANTAYTGRKLVAYNDTGESAPSAAFPQMVTAMPPLSAVISGTGPDFITVGVNAIVPNMEAGQSGLRFELLSVSGEVVASAVFESGWIQSPTHTFTGLVAGDSYQARVNARNQEGVETGWSSYSAPSETTEEARGTPLFTLDLRATQQARAIANNELLDPRQPITVFVDVANVGSVSGTNVFVNVLLPAYVVFDSDSLRIDGVQQTPAADGDAGQGNGHSISAIWGFLEPNQSHAISFTLRFDQEQLRAIATQPSASANPTLSLLASVSSSEVETPVSSPTLTFAADVSVLAPESEPVLEEPEPEPVPAPEPAPLPTPEEVVIIQQVLEQEFGGSQAGPVEAPTEVSTTDGAFGVEVTSGGQTLSLTGNIETVDDQVQFNGTTSLPFTVVTLILNNSVVAIAVSDATGHWQTFVDADRIALALGGTQILRVEAVAANGDIRSARVTVGEIRLSRARDGEVQADFDKMVSPNVAIRTIQEVDAAIEAQEPAIRATLSVAAPVVVISSVPLWGYLPYTPTLAYHFITYAVGAIGRRRRKSQHAHGVVYDSITKQPLALAIIRIYAISEDTKKLVTTVVSDSLGRYEALLAPARYTVEVTKPTYQFPSQIVTASVDGLYEHVYQTGAGLQVLGEAITIPDLPLDPINTARQWQLANAVQKVGHGLQRIGNYLAAPVLIVGSVVSAAVVVSVPSRPINWVIAGMYIILLALQLSFRQKMMRAWGVVYDIATNAVLPLTAVQLIEPGSSKVVTSRLSDYQGRFAFLPEPGTYVIKASKAGYQQVAEVVEAPQIDRQPLHGEVRIEKPDQRISGDIAMRQSV